MNTAYIYSATRFNTLGTELFSRSDIDRLLLVSSSELPATLEDTYLAPYLSQVGGDDISDAVELTLAEARRLIYRLVPDGEAFGVLWVRHDIHNLRVLAKSNQSELSWEELEKHLVTNGHYLPVELYERVSSSTLNRLEAGWQDAYDKAVQLVLNGELDKVDAVFDALFFTTVTRIVGRSNDAFMKRYVKAMIDIYNIKNTLRRTVLSHSQSGSGFVSGGTFSDKELESKDQAVAALAVLAPDHFTMAIDAYESTGHTNQLDAALDDYLLTLTKNASVDLFGTATIVLYYLRTEQAAANLRAILVGKQSGLTNEIIKTKLRLAYVN